MTDAQILKRFMAGESMTAIGLWITVQGKHAGDIEDRIRRAIIAREKRRKRRAKA